jgi:Flp pilus assembly protein TadG
MMSSHSEFREHSRGQVRRGRILRLRMAGKLAACLGADTDGAQLLEFALGLPFLLVIVIGIIDFGGAFNLKQKMANAAREGARVSISNTLSDSSCTSSSPPCSIQSAVTAVANYMTNAGVDSACLNSAAAANSGTDSWTFTCASGIALTIDHAYSFTPSGGSPITATKVTLTYPYTWTFGRVIGLLVRGANASLPTTLTTTAVMQNLVSN